MNTSGLLQSKTLQEPRSIHDSIMFTLQETRSIHDSMNITKIEFITYIYKFILSVKYQFSIFTLAGFPDILNLIRHNVEFGIAKTPNFRA